MSTVTMLPLEQLVEETGTLVLRRGQYLNREELTSRLQMGRVRFVVADIGKPLAWVPAHNTYRFWKTEIKSHLPDNPDHFRLEDFAGHYCYLASEWTGSSEVVILLERYH